MEPHEPRRPPTALDRPPAPPPPPPGLTLELPVASGAGAEARAACCALQAAEDRLDRGIHKAARCLGAYGRRASAEARELAAPVATAVSEGAAQVEGHLRELDALVFDRLKAGLRLAREHQVAALGAGTALALVGLPGPRSFLWRFAVTRLRSPEGLFKTAVRQQEELAGRLQLQRQEGEKLAERARLAGEELRRGQAKLTAARRELEALEGRLSATEGALRGVAEDLRMLPMKAAFELRAQVANDAAGAAGQRRMTGDLASSILSRYGL